MFFKSFCLTMVQEIAFYTVITIVSTVYGWELIAELAVNYKNTKIILNLPF